MSWSGSSVQGAGRFRERFPEGMVEPVPMPRAQGPRVGLALGGGSARGWSHIGVIEVLEEAGIYPETVAGCSIGAVVGGCYAAGKLDLLKAFALSLTKRRVMGLLDVRLGSGLIAGDRLKRRLERDLGDRRIEGLPIRFASVATELGTGDEVWLTDGPLVDAVRASYALPGIFPPVRYDSRLLMDGTLVNPVPVKVARSLGADLVICVNLNCDPRAGGEPALLQGTDAAQRALFGKTGADVVDTTPNAAQHSETAQSSKTTRNGAARRGWSLLRGAGRRRPPSAPGAPGMARVMLDAFNITQDRISRARLASDPPDAIVSPQLAGMGLFEFHRADEAIAAGRQAAKAALPGIRAVIASAAARV